jgi:hypothetical protein
VAVVGNVREKRDSGRRSKLRGVMKLQTGIGDLGGYFWPNGLPQFWGRPPPLVRLVRNQFHGIFPDDNIISISRWMRGHKREMTDCSSL